MAALKDMPYDIIINIISQTNYGSSLVQLLSTLMWMRHQGYRDRVKSLHELYLKARYLSTAGAPEDFWPVFNVEAFCIGVFEERERLSICQELSKVWMMFQGIEFLHHTNHRNRWNMECIAAVGGMNISWNINGVDAGIGSKAFMEKNPNYFDPLLQSEVVLRNIRHDWIVNSAFNPQVIKIILSHCKIYEHSANGLSFESSELQEMAKSETLEELHLLSVHCTDDVVGKLKILVSGTSNLKLVHLSLCLITPANSDKLKQSLSQGSPKLIFDCSDSNQSDEESQSESESDEESQRESDDDDDYE